MSNCPACDKGEKYLDPPHSGIVGSMRVHYPSGNICMNSAEWEELQKRVRVCKDTPAPKAVKVYGEQSGHARCGRHDRLLERFDLPDGWTWFCPDCAVIEKQKESTNDSGKA